MKTISKSVLSILCLVVTLLTTTVLTAQSKSSTKDFVIMVKKEGTNIKLKCARGCAWTDLEFSTTSKSAQAIDQNGMVNADSKAQKTDKNLADFQFTIALNNKGFVLNGVKGTAWETLNLTTKTSQMINKDGVLPQH